MTSSASNIVKMRAIPDQHAFIEGPTHDQNVGLCDIPCDCLYKRIRQSWKLGACKLRFSAISEDEI